MEFAGANFVVVLFTEGILSVGLSFTEKDRSKIARNGLDLCGTICKGGNFQLLGRIPFYIIPLYQPSLTGFDLFRNLQVRLCDCRRDESGGVRAAIDGLLHLHRSPWCPRFRWTATRGVLQEQWCRRVV